MNNKAVKNLVITLSVIALIAFSVIFSDYFIKGLSAIAVMSAKSYMPFDGVTLPSFTSTTAENTTTEITKETTSEKKVSASVTIEEKFTDTPEDIIKAMEERKKTASKDKKDGGIYERQYKSEGVTDSFGSVRVKNVNKTGIDIEGILTEKIDLSVSKDKPSVLIFHTHTTETFQILDRGFYESI